MQRKLMKMVHWWMISQSSSWRNWHFLNDTNPKSDLWCSLESKPHWFVWPEENWHPDWAMVSQGFFPSISVTEWVWVPQAHLFAGNYSVILLIWLYWHYWMRTELSWTMTSLFSTALLHSWFEFISYLQLNQQWTNL